MSEARQIDYDALLHEAFRDAQRSVMRSVLTQVAESGLPGEHHFYISFNTLAPGVSIAPRLLQRYPAEMTIVLQHRFRDLFVQADRFEVKLTFDSIPERLVIPFASVRVFFDPIVPYGLQFDEPIEARQMPMGEMLGFPGRGGRSAGRNDRPATERKKTARKAKTDIAAELAPVEAPPGSVTKAIPPSTEAVAVPAAAAKTGPRLVQSANDSPKVVSLDQFRKK